MSWIENYIKRDQITWTYVRADGGVYFKKEDIIGLIEREWHDIYFDNEHEEVNDSYKMGAYRAICNITNTLKKIT